MKKSFIFSSILLSLSFCLSGTHAATSGPLTEIHCELVPITHLSIKYRQRHHHDNNRSNRHKIRTRPHLPKHSNLTSLNWGGYAAVTNLNNPATNSVTAVTGSWIVPTLSSSSQTSYSATWVGIDGYSSSTVEQIGTEQDWINGRQQNYAWFEMYPQYPYELIGFPVSKGDTITARVVYAGNNTFNLSITNVTRGVFANIPTSYTVSRNAKRSSAEWIVEAPSSSRGVLPLAHFNNMAFSSCSATINGITGAINNPRWANAAIQMVASRTVTKALPSSLSGNGQAFNVAWLHQ